MPSAPHPANEGDRIRALRSLHVLDTSPEERFDRVTRLVAELLDVPIALVSLVDTDRQWFKSSVGLDVTETSRDLAFCAHAIVEQGTMVIEDATRDPRFQNNPLVLGEPTIRFYAGAQMVTREGHRLGTLCAIDRRPRSLEPRQLALLEELSRLVIDELELTRANAELAALAERLATSNRDMGLISRVIAHDLRAPLRHLVISAELACDSDPGERREALAAMTQAANTAYRLLDELSAFLNAEDRDLSKIERLDEVLEATLRDARPAIEAANGSAVLKNACSTLVPSLVVGTVVRNLIDNAVKYRASDRPLRVGIEAEVSAGGVSVIVEDNGVGILALDIERVFDPLFRGSKQGQPGTGMGLSIARRLAERANGTIVVRSTPDVGTTFVLWLPCT